MADTETYILDDDKEFFNFEIFGNKYKFRYLTSDEMRTLDGIKGQDKILDYFSQFIEPQEGSVPFKEVEGKMKSPHIKKLLHMLSVELGNADN